ncbi:hypothetical protein ILUMI_17550 [Ignelater luminosus]|uniref:Integrase zinc-binding domain-containing protein n=1 Tax=Ignelater luminosus TaxID=2038154 RepID=A0A8K0CJN7_IGNLU|nr:hypothetical protein ILUMI_17550 [Ignelater luminosus]
MKALLKVRVQDSNKTNENYTTPDDSTETNYLTINEVEAAEIALLKIAQIQAFSNELCCLQRDQKVGPFSSLKSLAPFLDSSGIMRVGGRLIHSDLSYDQKHQIIIPYSHSLTTLIISCEHRRSLHAGAQTTLSFVRQKYWPIRGKQIVKRCIRHVRTKTGITKRDLSKVCLLPSEEVQISDK